MQTLIEEVDIEIPAPFMDLYSPYRYKAYFGGRGSAKSHSFAKALLCEGYDKKLRILCGREVQRSIKDSVKLLLDDQIEILGLQDHYTSLQNEIRGANGTVFLFAGLGAMTTDQIKSMEGIDRCWIEEAQTISQRSLVGTQEMLMTQLISCSEVKSLLRMQSSRKLTLMIINFFQKS